MADQKHIADAGSHQCGTRPKLGRPPKPEAEKMQRVESWVPLPLAQWIAESGGSHFLRRLIEQEYQGQ